MQQGPFCNARRRKIRCSEEYAGSHPLRACSWGRWAEIQYNRCSRFKEISSKEGIVTPNLRNREGFLEAPVCIFPHPSHAVPPLCSAQVCGGKFRNLQVGH